MPPGAARRSTRVGGSAPDIAGKDVANPLACILSFSMMLKYSFDMPDEADLVENAVRRALAWGGDQRHRATRYRARLDPSHRRHGAGASSKRRRKPASTVRAL
jgi:hypothetical protein